jgi:hypothetical protein
MNPIEQLFQAINNKQQIAEVFYDGHCVRLHRSWNIDYTYELYHIFVDYEIIHSARRSNIRNIIKEWMEGKRELKTFMGSTLLFKC